MRKFILLLILIVGLSFSTFARAKYQGIAGKGGKLVKTSSTTTYKLQETYPLCTITVYLAGTTTIASIYSDNSGTVKANPFSSNSVDANYSFYANNGRYDIKFSGIGITTPFTLADIFLIDTNSLATGITLKTNTVANGSQAILDLKSGANVTLTDDGVGGVTIAAAGGSSGGFCSGAENIEDYGADPTGVTSSRTAMVTAYTAAVASNKRVCMPAGTFLLSIADFNLTGHQLYITDSNVEWYGAGIDKTIIKVEENITPSADPTIMYISGDRANVHDFTIYGATNINGTDSPVGIGLRNSKNSYIHHIKVTNLNNNIAAGGGAAGAVAFDYTASGAVSYEELSTTTLGTTIIAGTRTVTPASMLNIAVGRRLKIGGTTEYIVVIAVTQTTFTAVFANAHNLANSVTTLGEGQDAAVFAYNEVRDCYNCSGFVVNAQDGHFLFNRLINGGGNSNNGCHAFYVQMGGNLFQGNHIEYFGLPSIQEYPGGTGAREMTANRWINNDITSFRHFFTGGAPQINDGGVIVSVPVNYSLNRQQIFIGNHFRTPWKTNVAGVNTIGNLELGPRFIFEGNYLENSAIQQVPLASDVIVDSKVIGNTFVGIDATYSWGVLVRDNATVADNKFLNINTSSGIGSEAVIAVGSFSNVHDNRIIGGNYFYAIFAIAEATKIHDNIITGATAGTIAAPKALGIRGSTNLEIYNNYIDGNAVIAIIEDFSLGGTNAGTIKFYGNNIKNFALDSGRIILNGGVTQWNIGLDFYDNEIPQLATTERNSKRLWPGGRNVTVDVNQNELVGYDSNGRFSDITTASTRFFGIYDGPQQSMGVATDNLLQFVVYEVGAEYTVKTDGNWARGNVGIISTTAAKKIHDTGSVNPPAAFATSYVLFLDSGSSGAGSAKVRIIKGY